MRRQVFSIALLTIAFAPTLARPETVIVSQRLGNNTEDITYVSGGLLDGNIVIMDGYDVLAGPLVGPAPTKIFDVRALGVNAPRGIVYVPSTDRFYYGSTEQTDKLFVTDQAGVVQAPLMIQWPNPTNLPIQFEGLDYVPPTDPMFPDHIAAVTFWPDFFSRIDFISPSDGSIAGEITASTFDYITGLAYIAPNKLAVYDSDGIRNAGIWLMDFTGSAIGTDPVAVIPESDHDLEGLVLVPPPVNRFVAAGYSNGRLYVMNTNFERIPAEDRDYAIGLGITNGSVTWNSDSGSFIFRGMTGGGDRVPIFSVPDTLDSRILLTDLTSPLFLSSRGIGYLPGENLVALSYVSPRGLAYFDATDGHYVSRINLVDNAACPPLMWRPIAAAPLSGNQLALRIAAQATLLQVISRTGQPVTDEFSSEFPGAVRPDCQQFPPINLATNPQGAGLASFDPGTGGQFLAGRYFFNLDGSGPVPIDLSALGLFGVGSGTFITSGTYAGDYAVVGDNSTLVIFSIP
jgi:hypothetical protein